MLGSRLTNTSGVSYRKATAADISRCIEIRGLTRQNPMTARALQEFGVTEASWRTQVEKGESVGVVALMKGAIVGCCFGDTTSGEVQTLALMADFEGKGMGSKMLTWVSSRLYAMGFERIWLAASPDPQIRAYGFYRHLGWRPSGKLDRHGDEILEHTNRARQQ